MSIKYKMVVEPKNTRGVRTNIKIVKSKHLKSLKACLKRKVFSLFLNNLKLSMFLIVIGNVFHSLGAAAMNARSPIVANVLKLGLESRN